MSSTDLSKIGFDSWRGLWQYDGNLLHTLGLLFLLIVAYGVAQGIYRIWFHPLSKFPGPLHLSLTSLPAAYSNYIQGTWVRHVAKLHQKYGPAVRIGPNHVSLDGSIGWPEVYGHSRIKSLPVPDLYAHLLILRAIEQHEALVSASRDGHRRQRRQLGHAFSDAALAQQEPVIIKYVDMMLDRLSRRADEGQSINIVEWLNFTTFDIIGDLYYPLIGWIIGKSSRRSLAKYYSGPDPDIIAYMMKKTRDGGDGMSESEVLVNTHALVVAGSETTATALSGFCFYLSRNPLAYTLLADEIRAAFASEEDINLVSTRSLEYLQACINEILRMYPPAAETATRVSPGDMVDGKFVPAGNAIFTIWSWELGHHGP
ncbi:cytochrome p450 [Hirsutella rhossiliensis]|uniref:Cytochrome p450 domain-containing protein n=1 Tax=Hirsutella rhossiliensis TaxID=111463 RepID=A0A9P8SFU7_9HYPO|nr:cytochrome p450 domain-containing protein [Hirsutella rhossiliensis]KAH0959376.1 cytochrome p450 domain-containing protein [Hirsutella rhossiliensis]